MHTILLLAASPEGPFFYRYWSPAAPSTMHAQVATKVAQINTLADAGDAIGVAAAVVALMVLPAQSDLYNGAPRVVNPEHVYLEMPGTGATVAAYWLANPPEGPSPGE